MEAIDTGLTQGGPSSPALFNILINILVETVKESLKAIRREGECADSSPILAFADDFMLQLDKIVEAIIVIRAAGR